MYFPDFSDYNFNFSNQRTPLREVKTVGWLSREHPFPTGSCDPSLLEKLHRLCVFAKVNQMMGFHLCELCGNKKIYLITGTNSERLIGEAEIWVIGTSGALYAAPNMIVHYISEHNYLPPKEFLEALASSDENEIIRRIPEFERRTRVGGDWDWRRPDDPQWWL